MSIEVPPRVVIDTNVMVSFALSGRGAAAGIFEAIIAGRMIPVITREIEAEYREVTARPALGIDSAAAAAAIEIITRNAVTVKPAVWRGRLPDRDDEMFVRAAMSTGTRIITTHNARHYPRTVCAPVRIMTPKQALSWLKIRAN